MLSTLKVAVPTALVLLMSLALPASYVRAQACNTHKTAYATGRLYTDTLADELRRASNADEVLHQFHGMAYTMEARSNRLIIVTGKDGVIQAIYCD
jgi:hypothetical protein